MAILATTIKTEGKFKGLWEQINIFGGIVQAEHQLLGDTTTRTACLHLLLDPSRCLRRTLWLGQSLWDATSDCKFKNNLTYTRAKVTRFKEPDKINVVCSDGDTQNYAKLMFLEDDESFQKSGMMIPKGLLPIGKSHRMRQRKKQKQKTVRSIGLETNQASRRRREMMLGRQGCSMLSVACDSKCGHCKYSHYPDDCACFKAATLRGQGGSRESPDICI